jgi:flavin-dependent dehydrogenase
LIGKTDRSDPEVSPNSLARYLWDVAIIGAGPAGATAAINLSKNGHRVLLIDKESFPRDKICGDGLIADAIGSLRRSGLYEEVFSNSYFVRSSTIYSPSRIQFSLPGEFLTIKRFTLDNLIVRKAVLSGTTFLRGKITDIEPQ